MINIPIRSNKIKDYRKMLGWCYEHFGPSGYTVYDEFSSIRWQGNYFNFSFRDETDAAFFALRWA